MGLDITLGVIIFLAAIRGWLKGFLYQAVRIAALIACVFLADPVRRQARPHVAPYFTSIKPEMLDRILWWLAGGVSYIALVGVVSLLIALARRPDETGVKPGSSANDRFAGFVFGAAKGFLVAIFLTAGVQKYALSQLKAIPWTEQQVTASKALVWNQTYEPVPKIWQSAPIQHFVGHVQKMGLPASEVPPAKPPAGQVAERTSQTAAGRNPRLAVAPNGGSAALGAEIEAALDGIKAQIEQNAGQPASE